MKLTQYSPFYLSLEITNKIFTLRSYIGVKFFLYRYLGTLKS